MNRIQLFKRLHASKQMREAYICKVPGDINALLVDNTYVNLLEDDHATMLNIIFDEYAKSVEWFLYDWKPGYLVGCNGVKESIRDIDHYIDWMQRMEGFDRE